MCSDSVDSNEKRRKKDDVGRTNTMIIAFYFVVYLNKNNYRAIKWPLINSYF